MKTLSLLIICILLWSLATTPPVRAQDDVVKAAVVVVGPPVGFKDANGELAGLGVDVVKAVAKAAELNVTFVEAPSFSELVQGVAAGTYDMTAVCLFNTPERAKLMAFSEPYQPTGIVLVAAAENRACRALMM